MGPNKANPPSRDHAGSSNPNQSSANTASVDDTAAAAVSHTIQGINGNDATLPPNTSSVTDFLPRSLLENAQQRMFAALIRDILREDPTRAQLLECLRSDLDPLLLCAPAVTKNPACCRALENILRQFGIPIPPVNLYRSPTVRLAHLIYKEGNNEEAFQTVYAHIIEKRPHPYGDPATAVSETTISSPPMQTSLPAPLRLASPASVTASPSSAPNTSQSACGSNPDAFINGMHDVLHRFQAQQTAEFAQFQRDQATKMKERFTRRISSLSYFRNLNTNMVDEKKDIINGTQPHPTSFQHTQNLPPPSVGQPLPSPETPNPGPSAHTPHISASHIRNQPRARNTIAKNDVHPQANDGQSRAIAIQKAAKLLTNLFKDKRFKGTIADSWPRAIRDYEHIVLEVYNLDEAAALTLLPFMLDDKARDHFEQEIHPNVQDYQQAKAMMSLRFHNEASQRCILYSLRKLRFSYFKGGNCSIAEIFDKVTAEIEAKFPRIPRHFQNDHFKRELLISAMEREDWCAVEVKRPISTYPRYQDLVIALADCAHRHCVTEKAISNEWLHPTP